MPKYLMMMILLTPQSTTMSTMKLMTPVMLKAMYMLQIPALIRAMIRMIMLLLMKAMTPVMLKVMFTPQIQALIPAMTRMIMLPLMIAITPAMLRVMFMLLTPALTQAMTKTFTLKTIMMMRPVKFLKMIKILRLDMMISPATTAMLMMSNLPMETMPTAAMIQMITKKIRLTRSPMKISRK